MDRFPPMLDMIAAPAIATPSAAEVLQRVFALLDATGIGYCLTHGYEGLPHRRGSDVDILIGSNMSSAVIGRLISQHESLLGARLVRRVGLYMILACAPVNGIPEYLILDFSHDVRVDGHLIASGEAVLSGRRRRSTFWIPSAADAFDIQLARAIIKRRLAPETTAALSRLFAEDPAGSQNALARRWSTRQAARISAAAETGDWSTIIAEAAQLRRHLLFRNFVRSPLASLANAFKVQAARVRRFLRPAGLHVALLGPDGAGKSSTIAALEEGLSPLFARTEVRGFAPSLRQLLRRQPSSTATPHALSPRSPSTSLLRAAWWAAYALASHVSLRIARSRATLVLNDRHFIDILVDPVRYRYGGPRWALKAVWWLTPRPDLVILLTGRPGVLQARKREITVEATAKLCRGYEELVSGLACGRIINAEMKPAEVIGEAAAAIVAAGSRNGT